jgi:hypothetical protein
MPLRDSAVMVHTAETPGLVSSLQKEICCHAAGQTYVVDLHKESRSKQDQYKLVRWLLLLWLVLSAGLLL